MPPDPKVAAAVKGYGAATETVRARVLAFVERSWGGLGSWRDADIDRFVAQVLPVVRGGQRQAAALTDAYLAQVAAAVFGGRARLSGVPDRVIDEIRGHAKSRDVYRRPGAAVWTGLAEGLEVDEAVKRGLTRALALASTDLQLAKTHATRHVLSADDRVTGYRRALRSGKSCSLCKVASDRIYKRDALLPVHNYCRCSVVPVYGDVDPGAGLNDTASEPEDGLADDGVATREHGEVGPLLVPAGHAFTGPDL